MDINVDDHENHDSYQNNHSSTNRRKELTINSNDCINQVCAWYELFMSGKLPHRRAYHVSFYWNDHFYVHGGQDLKEGAYGDLWRVDYQFIFNETQLINDNQIQNIEWEEIQLSGVYPKKLSHHAGILQPALQSYIIYGGIVGADSSDVLYVINLNNFNVQAIPSNQQTEKNGKSLPGPRDDFWGYKNGQKMNDIFKLHILDRGRQFVWELLEIQGKSCPQPRSGFSGVCLHDSQGNEEVYIIGGAGDNSNRFNDLWKYENHKWTLIATDGQDQDDIPQERGGHQCCVYENRFIVIFGGIHEITYELNDLHIFDIKNGKWFLCNENNQNASQSGSPKNKAIMQQSDAFKKNQNEWTRITHEFYILEESSKQRFNESIYERQKFILGSYESISRLNNDRDFKNLDEESPKTIVNLNYNTSQKRDQRFTCGIANSYLNHDEKRFHNQKCRLKFRQLLSNDEKTKEFWKSHYYEFSNKDWQEILVKQFNVKRTQHWQSSPLEQQYELQCFHKFWAQRRSCPFCQNH
eukprot:403331423